MSDDTKSMIDDRVENEISAYYAPSEDDKLFKIDDGRLWVPPGWTRTLFGWIGRISLLGYAMVAYAMVTLMFRHRHVAHLEGRFTITTGDHPSWWVASIVLFMCLISPLCIGLSSFWDGKAAGRREAQRMANLGIEMRRQRDQERRFHAATSQRFSQYRERMEVPQRQRYTSMLEALLAEAKDQDGG